MQYFKCGKICHLLALLVRGPGKLAGEASQGYKRRAGGRSSSRPEQEMIACQVGVRITCKKIQILNLKQTNKL